VGLLDRANLWSACNTQRWLQAGRLGQCTSLILKAGSGWHQVETAEDPQNINKFAAGSLDAVTAHRIKWILSGRSAVEQMRQWQQALQAEQIKDAGPKRVSPLSAFQNHRNKGRRHDGYCKNTSHANAWYSENVARWTTKTQIDPLEWGPAAGRRAWESMEKLLWSTGLLALCNMW